MRNIFLFMHISLDGYVEGPNHDISWFNADDDHFETFSRKQSKEADTILFGHKTYKLMESYWHTQYAKEANPEIAQYVNETSKVVVASKPFKPGWNNVTVISGDVIGKVKKLKEQQGKNIIILGSNRLSVSLMQMGLVDEFRIVVNPIALGNGTSLFEGLPKEAELTLTDTLKFKSGKIMLTYLPRK
jgi:dihydrofolate reductase